MVNMTFTMYLMVGCGVVLAFFLLKKFIKISVILIAVTVLFFLWFSRAPSVFGGG